MGSLAPGVPCGKSSGEEIPEVIAAAIAVRTDGERNLLLLYYRHKALLSLGSKSPVEEEEALPKEEDAMDALFRSFAENSRQTPAFKRQALAKVTGQNVY
jgi:hypothetical protein